MIGIAAERRSDEPAGSTGTVRDFRDAVARAAADGELVRIAREVDPHLEMCAVAVAWRHLPRRPLLLFERLTGYPGIRGVFNMFTDRTRLSRALGMPGEAAGDKRSYLEALDHPIPPRLVASGPCQENVITRDIDIAKLFPPIHGASHVSSLYFQPITIARDPVSGVKNTAMYRAAVQGPTRLTVNARWDQHTGYLLSGAKAEPRPMPVALCLGVHPALSIAAVTKMRFGEDELAFAGGIMGEPLELVKCKTIDLEVPATAEIVIEGEFRPPFEMGSEGPWPEYLSYLGMETHPPIMDITAVTFRNDPIVSYEVPPITPQLIGMGTQASFFRYLRSIAGGFVVDSLITPATRMHHAIVKVQKREAHHEGLQVNLALGAFGFLNAIDLVIVVDEDVDITNWAQVEWAIATRCDPAKQVHILGPGRSQQVNPIVGVKESFGEPLTKGKWIIDATAPWQYRQIEKRPGIGFFTRSEWPEIDLEEYVDQAAVERWLRPSAPRQR